MNAVPNTINMMVGPTGCGKSTYCRSVYDQLKSAGVTSHIISSDNIRQTLLDAPTNKSDPRMLEVSEQAFTLLFEQLNCLTSFPVNSPYVMVDTTGLDGNFRSKVYDLANRNGYNVEVTLFLYKNRADYELGLDPQMNKSVLARHIRKLFREELQKITSSGERQRYSVLTKLASRTTPTISYAKSEAVGYVDYNKTSLIIGDVHGAYDKLLQVLARAGVKINENGLFDTRMNVVFVGDILDKAPRTEVEKCLDLIVPNLQAGTALACLGNHERFFANSKRTNKNAGVSSEIVAEFFESSLETDEAFVAKALALHDLSKVCIYGPGFVVTHSPCHTRSIGKTHGRHFVNQVNWKYTRLTDQQFNDEFHSFFADRSRSAPCHIFGHIGLVKSYKGRGWRFIDTGGKLTGAIVKPYDFQHELISSDGEYTGRVLTALREERQFNTGMLQNARDRKRIRMMLENKVNFISGTMSPVGVVENNLEDIRWGLNYYKSKGIDEIWLSPKFMGSRAQVYLFDDPAKCYCVSRNGYKISNTEPSLFEPLITKFRGHFDYGLKMRILDAELMPWSFLGQGLIDQNFMPSYYLAKNEIEYATKWGFPETFQKLAEASASYPDFAHSTKADFCAKHKHHVYKMLEGYYSTKRFVEPADAALERLTSFKERLDKYCGHETPSLYPFAILKDVFEGNEVVYGYGTNTYEKFTQINTTPVEKFSVDDIEGVQRFFHEVGTTQLLEGVVMRPLIDTERVAPYFKIRHPDYLTLAYGYDYRMESKLNKLISRKNVSKKIKRSIDDYKLGMKMLEIPYGDLSIESLLVEFVIDNEKTGDIDPRL